MPTSYIRVRAVVWAYGRGQTDTKTDRQTDRQTHTQTAVTTIHFASVTPHEARRGNGYSVGLAINKSRVQILLEATLRNNLGQVVHTYVPLSPSSITWYRPKGSDALQLGR